MYSPTWSRPIQGWMESAFQAMLEEAMDRGLVLDAAIAQSEADTASFWALRDATPEIMSHLSPMLAFDVSIPIGRIGEAVERMRGELEARWPGQDGSFRSHRRQQPASHIQPGRRQGIDPHSKPKPRVSGRERISRGDLRRAQDRQPSNARSCHCRAAPVRSR